MRTCRSESRPRPWRQGPFTYSYLCIRYTCKRRPSSYSRAERPTHPYVPPAFCACLESFFDSPTVPTRPNYFPCIVLQNYKICERSYEAIERCASMVSSEAGWWPTAASSILMVGGLQVNMSATISCYLVEDLKRENNVVVEATAYISAVAAFAAVVLVVLLFLGRRWCHSTAFSRKCRDAIPSVNPRVAVEPCSPLDNVQFGKSFALFSNDFPLCTWNCFYSIAHFLIKPRSLTLIRLKVSKPSWWWVYSISYARNNNESTFH